MSGSGAPSDLLTVPEVAQVLRVSRAQVYLLMEAAAFPVVRIGRLVRVEPRDLAAYIERVKTPSRSQRRLRSSA